MPLTVPLSKQHKREQFNCGNDSITRYLKEQASQDVKRKLALCFVTVDPFNNITGFYTLSNASISRDQLPEDVKRSLGYRDIPVTLLGRLARDISMKNTGHGEFLLMDAIHRIYHASFDATASFAIVTDPIDNSAESFYTRYGFVRLAGSKRMFIMMATTARLFDKK
jgi:predicted GNAT family N-acyltransferase